MDENIKTIFKDQFKKLPPELQQAVTANDLRSKLTALTLKYRLHIDKAAVLENEVVLVLMGMEDPEAFVTNAKNQLGISPEDARGLARDVNDQIFHPIREKLESFINTEAEAYAAANPSLAAMHDPALQNPPAFSAPPQIPPKPPVQSTPVMPASTQSTPTPSFGIGQPRRQPIASSEPRNSSILPQKMSDSLPALPKDIIADKLQPLSFKSAVSKTPASIPPKVPISETPAPKNEASFSMKAFGIDINSDKPPESIPAVSDTVPTVPKAPSTPPVPEKPAQSSGDPYREPV